jgi:predicted RNase H-like HicB family nuclease
VFGAKMATTYQVELERDEAGWWVASVPSVPGAHTQGRSIEQAMNRIRQALRLWVSDADEAELAPEIHLPIAARRHVGQALGARKRAAQAGEEASLVILSAIAELTDRQALSVRDVAALLELSPARVAQLKGSAGTKRSSSKKSAARRAAKKR